VIGDHRTIAALDPEDCTRLLDWSHVSEGCPSLQNIESAIVTDTDAQDAGEICGDGLATSSPGVHLPHRGGAGQGGSVLGVRVGDDGALYVLEGWTSFDLTKFAPVPNTGAVLRIKGGERTVIADHLNFPTAMTFGPQGDLYVSVNGISPTPGTGQVLKIALDHEHERD
jgi:hypothetical protein